MSDLTQSLRALSRPQLLTIAARHALRSYKRSNGLSRVLSGAAPKDAGLALRQLLGIESEMEAARQEASATYSARKHIAALTAIMSEAELYLKKRVV
ncbi:MAG: DUF6477 family protein [Pseudomonadota bacterium]